MRFSAKRILGAMVGALMLSGNAFAMTFSDPVEIGRACDSQTGRGFVVTGSTSNTGDLYIKERKDNKKGYGKGVAVFGTENDALYIYYNVYEKNSKTKIGGDSIDNTIEFGWMNDTIYKITSSEGITLYALNYKYGAESEWIVLGRRNDGMFVKYLDTSNVTDLYFSKGNSVSPVAYLLPICQGDTIIIPYDYLKKKNAGEFRFKWDDAAQWFGIEQVIY